MSTSRAQKQINDAVRDWAGVALNRSADTEKEIADAVADWESRNKKSKKSKKEKKDKKKDKDKAKGSSAPPSASVSIGKTAAELVGSAAEVGKRKTSTKFNPESREVVFGSDRFESDRYARDLFVEFTEQQAKLHLQRLQDYKEATANELRENVYHNYRKFIHTSQEIAKLENDMLQVRSLLNESKLLLKSLHDHSSKSTYDLSLMPLLSSSKKDKPKQTRSSGTNPSKAPNYAVLAQDILSKHPDELRFVLESCLDLHVAVAERQYAIAVDIVEKVTALYRGTPLGESASSSSAKASTDRDKERKELAAALNSAYPNVKTTVEQLTNQLVAKLITDVSNPALKKNETKTLISYLLRLGCGTRARDVFLESRKAYIKNQIRKLTPGGDVVAYMSDLARLVFSALSATWNDFEHAFGQTDQFTLMSGFVGWAVGELERFGGFFRSHVIASGDFQRMRECLAIVQLHCELLEDKGLALGFYLDRVIQRDISTAVRSAVLGRIANGLGARLDKENWTAEPVLVAALPVEGALSGQTTLRLTDSAKYLYATLLEFTADVAGVATVELVSTFVSAVAALLDDYLLHLATELGEHTFDSDESPAAASTSVSTTAACSLNDGQRLAIMANIHAIVVDLLPRVALVLESAVRRPVHEFDKLIARVDSVYAAVSERFALQKAQFAVSAKGPMPWADADYGRPPTVDEDMAPSSRFSELIKYLIEQSVLIHENLSPTVVVPLVRRIVDGIVHTLATDGPFFDYSALDSAGSGNGREPGDCQFSQGGLHQFVLDIRYFQEALGNYASDNANKMLSDMLSRAVMSYCRATNVEPTEALKRDKEWFASKVKKALKTAPRMGTEFSRA